MVNLSSQSIKMARFEEPPLSYEVSKNRAKVESHDLSEECLIEPQYMGTDADRHDMIVLGRKQVLRVCTNTARPAKLEWRCLRLLIMS